MPSPQAQEPLDELRRDLAKRIGDETDPRAVYEQAMADFPAPEGAGLARIEIVRDDARRLADAARRAGTLAELDVWPGMFHNFQLFASRLDEAAAALERAGEWARERLG